MPKTAFFRHFLKLIFEFKKKFTRYDQKNFFGQQDLLGDHFLVYRMFIRRFKMSAGGGRVRSKKLKKFDSKITKNEIILSTFSIVSIGFKSRLKPIQMPLEVLKWYVK